MKGTNLFYMFFSRLVRPKPLQKPQGTLWYFLDWPKLQKPESGQHNCFSVPGQAGSDSCRVIQCEVDLATCAKPQPAQHPQPATFKHRSPAKSGLRAAARLSKVGHKIGETQPKTFEAQTRNFGPARNLETQPRNLDAEPKSPPNLVQ